MGKKVKIKHIRIAGFKSIAYDKPVDLDLEDINILLGANGSGKSNIIGFFKMLWYMMNGKFQQYVAWNGGGQRFFHYGTEKTFSIDADIKLSFGENEDRYSFSLIEAAAGKIAIMDESISFHIEGVKYPHIKSFVFNGGEAGIIDSDNKTDQTIRRLLSQIRTYQFHDSSLNGPLRQPSNIDMAQYLDSSGKNIAAFLYYLKASYPSNYRNIVSYIKMVMPQFNDFELIPINKFVNLNWQDNSVNDYPFDASQFSDGTIRFIALATLLLQPEELMPSVIIIDEPELGLHPYALDQLAEMIKEASLHCQILISTQSTELINYFSLNDIIVLEEDRRSFSTIARRLNEDDFKDWLENYSNSELWNKNVIGGLPL